MQLSATFAQHFYVQAHFGTFKLADGCLARTAGLMQQGEGKCKEEV